MLNEKSQEDKPNGENSQSSNDDTNLLDLDPIDEASSEDFDEADIEKLNAEADLSSTALTFVSKNGIVESEDIFQRVRENAHLLPFEDADKYKVIVLNSPFGIFKYRLGCQKPISTEDKRQISRNMGVYTTAPFKYELLEYELFNKLFAEAYDKANITKLKTISEKESTRNSYEWGSNSGDSQPVDSNEALEDLGGTRYDISDLTSYYETRKKLEAGTLTLGQMATPDAAKYILQDVVKLKASDIHLQSNRKGGRIRYRVDGVMFERFKDIPKRAFKQLCNTYCNMVGREASTMKIKNVESVLKLFIDYEGEKKSVEFRFQSLDSLHNPSINMRAQTNPILDINQIGFTDRQLPVVLDMINNERGVIIITGETGSGKTNTLSAILNILEKPDDVNIIEMGSPIEIESDRRVQVNIRPSVREKETDIIYLDTFKSCMRSDPNVLAFTEIRNGDEAKVTFRASVTGHLAFTTFHSADVEETIGSFFTLGISRPIIAKGILGIISQKLIRTLCRKCRIEDKEYMEMNSSSVKSKDKDADVTIYQANEKGCFECNGGYSGRTVIAEVLQFDAEIRRMIDEGCTPAEIASKVIMDKKMIPMKEIALEKFKSGITSEEQVIHLAELKPSLNTELEKVLNHDDFNFDIESAEEDSNIIDAEVVD